MNSAYKIKLEGTVPESRSISFLIERPCSIVYLMTSFEQTVACNRKNFEKQLSFNMI